MITNNSSEQRAASSEQRAASGEGVRKPYEPPMASVILFDNEDVVTASGEGLCDVEGCYNPATTSSITFGPDGRPQFVWYCDLHKGS